MRCVRCSERAQVQKDEANTQKEATDARLKELADLIEAQNSTPGADGADGADASAASKEQDAAAEVAAAESEDAKEGAATDGTTAAAAAAAAPDDGDNSVARGAEVAALQAQVNALNERVEQLEGHSGSAATPESDEAPAGSQPPAETDAQSTSGDWASAQEVAELTESLARTDDNLAQLTGIVNELSDRTGQTQDDLGALMDAVSKRVASLNANRLGSLVDTLDGKDEGVPEALKSSFETLSQTVGKSVDDLNVLSDKIAGKFAGDVQLKAAMDEMVDETSDQLNALQTLLAADIKEQRVATTTPASLEVLASRLLEMVADSISGIVDDSDLNGEDSVAVLQQVQDMKGRNAGEIDTLLDKLHKAVMAAVEQLPGADAFAHGIHTDIELHERELRAAEKRLAKIELWVADQDHDDADDDDAADEEGADAVDGDGAASVTTSGGGGQLSAEQLALIKSQGDAIKVLKRRVRTAEAELESANGLGTKLQEELAALRAYAERSVRELQEAQMMEGGTSTVDNSTTVVRYDGKAMWKEELEGEVEVLNDRIGNVERILLDQASRGPTVGQVVEDAGNASLAKDVPDPSFAKGSELGPLHNSRSFQSNQTAGEKYLRAAGEGEIIRRVQALERAIATLSKVEKNVAASPEKAGTRRKRADGAELSRLQSQIRDLQTALSLIKRQLADAHRMSGRRGTGGFTGGGGSGRSAGKTGMLLGTRCMACDNPINVRKSTSAVPTMNHSAFQPYAAIPISEEKKTNHLFPGRTRVMTESPSVEDMRNADVRGAGRNTRLQQDVVGVVSKPKRWYDDDPLRTTPVVDLAKTEVVGPTLKQGGYRRAKQHDRAGAMRSNQGGLSPI